MILTATVFVASSVVADDILGESEAIAKIEQFGGKIIDGRPSGLSVTVEPVPFLVVPYWSLTIPLTFISLWLLLSKPRRSTPKKLDEPVPEKVA